jgi:hypothetical protein
VQQKGIGQHQVKTAAPPMVQKTKPAGKPPVAQHAAKAPVAKPAAAASGQRPAYELSPLEQYQKGRYPNAAGISTLANKVVGGEYKAALEPLRQQDQEIGSAAGNAATREAELGQTTQNAIGSLAPAEEASAKTAQNNAAEAAIKASNELKNAGAASAFATGGYVDPQVQSALTSGAQTAGKLGGAAGEYASAMGVNSADYLNNVRAAAAQRVAEGASRIGEGYQASTAKNVGEENKLLGKEGPAIEKERTALGKEEVADNVALRSVGAKEGTVKVDAAKVGATEKGNVEKTRSTEVKTKATAQADREKTAEAGNAVKEKDATTLAADEAKNATTIRATELHAKNALEVANKKAGKLTTSEEAKAITELSATYNEVIRLTAKGASPGKIRTALGKKGINVEVTNSKKEKVTKLEKVAGSSNGVLIQAAEEIAKYGQVNKITRQQLQTLGIEQPNLSKIVVGHERVAGEYTPKPQQPAPVKNQGTPPVLPRPKK